MRRRFLLLALLPLLAPAACRHAPATDPDYVARVDAWHARRLARLTAETGWLTLVGLHDLRPGVQTLGSAPDRDVRLVAKAPPRLGTLAITGDTLRFTPAAGVAVTAGDDTVPLAGPVTLRSDRDGEPTVLRTGPLLLYVIARGDRYLLRVKDRDSERRRLFAGIPRYPVDARWRVVARLDTAAAGTVLVANAIGQESPEPTPGVLRFSLAGRDCRLTPLGDPREGLFLVFADATTGRETYGGGRFLETDPVAPDGTVVLDFNRAYTPPCAFTDYATCPLPPAENRLPVAVTAGEKMPPGHH